MRYDVLKIGHDFWSLFIWFFIPCTYYIQSMRYQFCLFVFRLFLFIYLFIYLLIYIFIYLLIYLFFIGIRWLFDRAMTKVYCQQSANVCFSRYFTGYLIMLRRLLRVFTVLLLIKKNVDESNHYYYYLHRFDFWSTSWYQTLHPNQKFSKHCKVNGTWKYKLLDWSYTLRQTKASNSFKLLYLSLSLSPSLSLSASLSLSLFFSFRMAQ